MSFKSKEYAIAFDANEFQLISHSHLPPSQGGKYAGFGYSKEPVPKSQSQEFFDTTVSSLANVSDFTIICQNSIEN